MTTTTTISGSDDTQYGSAANGSTYRGQTVGSGYDFHIKRESENTALVWLEAALDVDRSPGRPDEWLTEQGVEPDEDLQALAVRIASQGPGWFEDEAVTPQNEGGWKRLTDRWDAITVD